MSLDIQQAEKLRNLAGKIKLGQASSSELNEFRTLLVDSDPFAIYYFDEILKNAGYNSYDELTQHIRQNEAQEALKALAVLALIFLAAYLLSKE